MCLRDASLFFFFNDTATTEIYTLSLHDALPISRAYRGGSPSLRSAPGRSARGGRGRAACCAGGPTWLDRLQDRGDRKSTRLDSSHLVISYAVFCLEKKQHYLI